jgi:hypothetical protein
MNGKIVLMLLVLALSVSAQAQTTPSVKQPTPIATTVCKILENPAAFNNKLVKARGYFTGNFEYSMLASESCSDAIWFALADSSGPPGLLAYVNGNGAPGERGSDGHWKKPMEVRLVRDSNFEKFENYLAESTKLQPGGICGRDCHIYRVTATFIGRIDGVSKEVHAAHLRRPSSAPPDFKGFGQMGLFDAQIVVQSVEDVEAVELSHAGKKATAPVAPPSE